MQSLGSDNVMTYVWCRLVLCSVYVADWMGDGAGDGLCAGLVGGDLVGTG